MSIDELARAAGQRAVATTASTTDAAGSLADLVVMRRRRARAAAILFTATVLVVALVVADPAGLARRRAEPATPTPTRTTTPPAALPYRGAPDVCAARGALAELLASASCTPGGGPGRYLALSSGLSTQVPYSVTVPPGWVVVAIPSTLDNGDPVPAGGGLMVRSRTSGDALAVLTYPNEVAAPQRGDNVSTMGQSPEAVARWLAARPDLAASPVTETRFAGVPAWQVDVSLTAPPAVATTCLLGPGCASVFGVYSDAKGPGPIGVYPQLRSRALLFSITRGGGPVVLVWTWSQGSGSAAVDPHGGLQSVLDSVDLSPDVPDPFGVLR